MLSLKAINLQGRLRILIGRELYARTSARFTKNWTFRQRERKFLLRRKMRGARQVSVCFIEASILIPVRNFREQRLQENCCKIRDSLEFP